MEQPRALVYLRQSADRTGGGAAVARQREDCLQLCARRGWTVANVYTDNDVSATSSKSRPAYVRMLDAVERGDGEVVVAWHVDRLTRKLTDLEALIELSERTGAKVATVSGDIDLTTDSGRLNGRILASVARGEIERKSARQTRAQQQAAEEGRPSGGRRAFGYAANGVNVVEDEAVRVKQGYKDLLAGASLKSIARRWNEAEAFTTMGNPWTHSTVRSTLQNARYAGLRTYRGEVVGPAIWPALVDGETHAAAVALLAMPERRTTANTARKFLLPSLAHCWKCGSDVATGHTRHAKRVYLCRRNKCISRAAEPVDALVEAVIIARLSQPDAVSLLSSPEGDTNDLKAQAAILRSRRDDLADALGEGILTLAAVRDASKRLTAELAAVEAQIHDAVHADVLTPVVTATDVRAAWEACDLAQKRAIIEALLTITLHPPKRGRQTFDPRTVEISWKA